MADQSESPRGHRLRGLSPMEEPMNEREQLRAERAADEQEAFEAFLKATGQDVWTAPLEQRQES